MTRFFVVAFTALFLTGCGSLTLGPTTKEWRGEAFGTPYRGSCATTISTDGFEPWGVQTGDRIVLLEDVCKGDNYTLRVLAHEVAHLTVCGSNEACASEQGIAWQEQGVTLADLGWPD